MGEMAEDFKALNKENKKHRDKKNEERLAYACEKLKGYRLTPGGDFFVINLSGGSIRFWPYTGWFAGARPYGKIKGRGISNLMKELEKIHGQD